MTIVLALGGHLLAHADPSLGRLLGTDRIVVTHGNGPQVGDALLLRPETALWQLVAGTQGEIGAPLAVRLGGACLVTHVVVDPRDPAFGTPTKPVGPVYGDDEELPFPTADDPGRGRRRIVPSPPPLEIVELDAIRSLLDAGIPAVACGGGGIPVVRRDGALEGVDAVIDKDRVSALLAIGLDAERLVIVTDVAAVKRGFGTSEAEELRELSIADTEALLPELAAGSMRPKVESAAAFARATGREALITDAASLAGALAGNAGTTVHP